MQVGETYDWRLSVANMERRDGYFTRLKLRIEMLHALNKEKVRLSPQGGWQWSAVTRCGCRLQHRAWLKPPASVKFRSVMMATYMHPGPESWQI